MALLQKCEFEPLTDRLWFAGDLVNRGPRSLDTLAWIYEHRACSTSVLGNHDLHLLMCSEGVRSLKPTDTLGEVLQSECWPQWSNWLRHCPLLHHEDGNLMVHAGLLPTWSLSDAVSRASHVENALTSTEYREFLAALSQKAPAPVQAKWSDAAETVGIMTRMRMLDKNGNPEFSFKSEPETAPAEYTPWFAEPHARDADLRVFFGHWAALGYRDMKEYIALDSGCVWKNKLTAYCLDDSKICQQEYCE